MKTPADVDATAAVGFTFFTIDPSGYVDQKADDYSENLVREKFAAVAGDVPWVESYQGRQITLSTGTTFELTDQACLRAAVKYGRAINQAVSLGEYIKTVQTAANRDYEIELSVDETDQPTTLAEHYIIADQCLSRGMKLVSLAPRFIGHFEKGVDFKGDLAALDRSLADHAAIAKSLGPYKLSLHSGSDKLSMYASPGKSHRRMFSRQDSRNQLSRSAACRREARRPAVSPADRLCPAIVTTSTVRRITSRQRCTRPPQQPNVPSSVNSKNTISNAGKACRKDAGLQSRVVRFCTARLVQL